jgi:hypothetical protein
MVTGGEGRMSESFNRNISAALGDPYRASSSFELPPLAVADTFESVCWLNANGTHEKPLARIETSDRWRWDTPDAAGDPQAYSLGAGRIHVYPQPTTGGVVRFQYQRQHPNLIVDSAAVGTISTATDLGGGFTELALSAGPTFEIGSYVDIINSQFPYRCIYSTLAVSASTAGTVTVYLPYSYVSSLSILGMRVVRSGESPYVHTLLELKSAIEDMTASVILRKTGDLTGSMTAEKAALSTVQLVMRIAEPRVKKQRVKAYHGGSLMRRRMR